MTGRDIPFRPKLEGDFRNRFYHAVSQITSSDNSSKLEKVCNDEIAWVEDECFFNIDQRKKYRAIWLLLRDLVRASWKAEFKDGVLMMRLPSVEEVANTSDSVTKAKSLLRSWMRESRLEKLGTFSDFIERMENGSANKKSIDCLIADGQELSDRLRKAQTGQIEICEAVKPYLQLVSDDDPIDRFTGQRISDIWRYFRMTWSTPAENTPGRTMQYLIRDAAQPMHAVMGIASLENCAVAITSRDNHLGWTVSAFKQMIEDCRLTADKAYELLLMYLNDGINGIDYSDLCTEKDVASPTLKLIQKLLMEASAAENERQALLTGSFDDEEEGVAEDLSSSEVSVNLLFKRKRSEQLAKYLNAKLIIQNEIQCNGTEQWETFFESENGSASIRTALTAQKSKHIGSSILELNVCGAIPPYNEILGGKLVALLTTSPQIINDYRVRYSDRKSEIASKMSGTDVCRPAELVYLGTTSLYSVGSSQYNRLKIPTTVFDSSMPIEWKRFGKTTGFGTLHISRATTMALKEATTEASARVNHVFGEGPSPKMRLLSGAIRELLETSSDDTKEFTKHAMSRIVFGVDLAENTTNYLLGIDKLPSFYTDTFDYKTGTEKIIRFWQTRWLAHRLQYEPIYERINSFKKESLLVSRDVAKDANWEFKKLKEVSVNLPEDEKLEGLQFIRSFYRGPSGYADNISSDLLDSIHVHTELDSAISEAVKAGKDVILTGNPGDGKTHIIRIMKRMLENSGVRMRVELDASTMSNDELYYAWSDARKENIPFVVAINAAVLHSLHISYPDYAPIQNAYFQMVNAVYFRQEPETISDIVVFDLSRRDVLKKTIISEVIKKLTSDQHYLRCNKCPLKDNCGVQLNRKLVNSAIFQERLQIILDRVSLQGYHATLRELQAFVSYLIFGDRECSVVRDTNGNSEYSVANLVYSGNGDLFKAINAAFDPVLISHPIWDEKILLNEISKESWLDGFSAPAESISPERLFEFNTRKRQFFFFNKQGYCLINILDDDVSRFKNYLSLKDSELVRVTIQKLNAFFGAKGEKKIDAWSGHRFNTSARRVLISGGSLREKQFAIGRPHLCVSMSSGMQITENYIRFELKDNSGVYLKIDFNMFRLLSEAENGVPVLFINDSNLVKNIWRFMEQLQSVVAKENENKPYVSVSLLDINNKSKYEIEIDVEDWIYKSITKTVFGKGGTR